MVAVGRVNEPKLARLAFRHPHRAIRIEGDAEENAFPVRIRLFRRVAMWCARPDVALLPAFLCMVDQRDADAFVADIGGCHGALAAHCQTESSRAGADLNPHRLDDAAARENGTGCRNLRITLVRGRVEIGGQTRAGKADRHPHQEDREKIGDGSLSRFYLLQRHPILPLASAATVTIRTNC